MDKSPGWSGRGALRSYRHAKMYGSHCRHLFHKSCVDPWLLDHRTCPMCKMNILKALGIPVSTVQPTASSCLSLHVSHSAGRKQHPGFLCPLDPGQWRHVMRAWERFPTSGHIPPLPPSPSENIVPSHRVCCFCLWVEMLPEQLTGSSSGLPWVTAAGTPAEARGTLMTLISLHRHQADPAATLSPPSPSFQRRQTRPGTGQRGQPLGIWLGGLC